jgi:hypothetical protein
MLPPDQRKLVAICGLLIAGSLIVLVIALGYNRQTQTKLAETTPSPEPVVAERQSNHPDFENIDALIRYGITKYQLDGVKYAYGKYKASTDGKIKTVTISSDTIASVASGRSDNQIRTVTYKGLFNGEETYRAKLDYWSLTALRLYLYSDEDGKQIYDSGPIDTYELKL